jgi:peptidyl-prolyl cis-trans isomerase C
MRFLTIAILVMMGLGCPPDPRSNKEHSVVVHVGNSTIHQNELLAELIWAGVARNPDQKTRLLLTRQIVDRLIDEHVLWLAAKESGLDIRTEDVEREINRSSSQYTPSAFQRVLSAEQMTNDIYLARVSRGMHIADYVKAHVIKNTKVSDSELRQLHEKQKTAQRQPERVLARQILVKTEEEAEFIYKEILSRRITFDDAIHRYYENVEGSRSANLGWFAKGELPRVFDICFTLEPKKVSRVIASDYGFHIFQVISKRPAGRESFEVAVPRLQAETKRLKQEQALASHVANLKEKMSISINEVALLETVSRISKPERGDNGLSTESKGTSPSKKDTRPAQKGSPAAKGKQQ